MANTIIQIRRSNTSISPSPSANLNYGELGFSYNTSPTGNTLYIGAQTGTTGTSIAIGGFKYNYLQNFTTPGVVAANATIVTDANSFVNNVYTTGLVVYQQSNTTLTNANFLVNSSALWINNVPLYANGSVGIGQQVLTSNGVNGSPYWSTVTSGTSGVGLASSGQVIFADSTAPNGSAGFTFTKGTNNVTIGNTLTIGTSVTNSTSFAVGTIGASTNGTVITQNLIQVGNTSVYSNIAPGAVFTTANVVTPILYGNVVATVVNASANMGVGTIGAASNGTLITPNLFQVGNTSVYSNVIPGAVYTTANVVTPTLYGNVVATVVNASANVGVGTIGAASNGVLITNALFQVGNTSVYSNVIPGAIYTTANLVTVNVYATSVITTSNVGVGTIGAASNGTLITNNLIQVGNNTVYSNVTPGAVYTTANVTTPTLFGNVVATVVNASANVGVGTIGVASNGTLITNNLIQVGNTTVYSNVTPGAVYTTANVVTPTLYGNVVATVVNASANVGVGTIGVASNGTLITNNLIQVGNTTVYSNVTPGAVYATANVTAPLHYGNVVATVVNASANVGVGTIGAASNGTLITNNLIQVGNTSVYSNVIPGAVYTTSNVVTVNVYATTVNATANVQTATLFGNVVATVVNASANIGVGTIGAASNGTLITNNLIQVGNNTVYSNVIPGAVYATANVTSPTFYGNVVATVVNASANVGVGTIGAASNGTLITNNLIQVGNTTVYSNVIPGAVYTTSNVVTVNVYATTINATANVQTNSIFATNVTATTITATNAVITGNLTVTGTLSTIDTVSLVIKDNIIGLADQNSPNYVSANGYTPQVITDAIDFGLIGSAPVQTAGAISATATASGCTYVTTAATTGFYVGELITGTGIAANTYITAFNPGANIVLSVATTAAVSSVNAYYTSFYGMARVQTSNTFTFFSSNVQIASPSYPAANFPFSTTVGTTQLMPLSFMGLTTAANVVTIAANATVNVFINANTLTLSTALGAGSGGTGLNTLTAGAVLYGNGTSAVGLATVGANGTVLQITSNVPAFGGIDGGAF
jgi:hypothetical protein